MIKTCLANPYMVQGCEIGAARKQSIDGAWREPPVLSSGIHSLNQSSGVFVNGSGLIDFPACFRMLEKNNSSGWMVGEQDVKFSATPIAPARAWL